MRVEAEPSPAAIAKLSEGGNVTTTVLTKTYGALDHQLSDIVTVLPNKESENNDRREENSVNEQSVFITGSTRKAIMTND